jgi:hypothetical protein
MKTNLIGYWVTTTILVFAVLSGGGAELARRRENLEGIVRLGYPLYCLGRAALAAAQGIGLCRQLFQYDRHGCIARGVRR